MTPTRNHAAALGGLPYRSRSKSLHELMLQSGFDPGAGGSEWALIITDTHSNVFFQKSQMDHRIRNQLALLEGHPPDHCLHLGDLLGDYVAWGSAPVPGYGKDEITKANVLLATLDQLAPLKLILGNHDCHAKESPLGTFMLANCRFFTSLHHTFTMGGVKFIMISTTHDGALIESEQEYLEDQLATVTEGQEVVICAHHTSGGRTNDHLALPQLMARIPSEMENPLWMFVGHDHAYADRTFALPNTSLAQWTIGAGGGPEWIHFGPDYMPTMAAVACRDGAVYERYIFSGIDRHWYLYPEVSRSSPIVPDSILDGLENEDVLSSYVQGTFDNGVHINNAPGSASYGDNDSWLVYIFNVEVNFPIPVGATKFWFVANQVPSYAGMSAAGSGWAAVTVPALYKNACILTIPEGLRANPTLHVKIQGVTTISAWGFAL